MKDRFTVIYFHKNGNIEVIQYLSSTLLELTLMLVEHLKSADICELIDEEELALNLDVNIYRECFPLIPVEDAINVWIFSLATIDAYIFKMSPVVS